MKRIFALLLGLGLLLGFTGVGGASGVPACQTSQLVAWLDTMGSGVAGGTYYRLQFSNFSGHVCTLEGYPIVSSVGLRGFTKGAPSSDNPTIKPTKITLQPLDSSSTVDTFATSILKITDAGNYGPSLCGYVTAAGLLITLPGQVTSLEIPFPFQACNKKVNILSVEAIEKGMSGG